MSRVANRYSKALFEAAVGQHKLDKVKSDLSDVEDIIHANDDFDSMLRNPLIAATKKAGIMRGIFAGKLDILTENFLVMLCLKKRAEFLQEIISSFAARVLELEGIISGQVISPAALSNEQFRLIEEKITKATGLQVQLTQQINENLIGGFVVKIKDTVIDLSVSNQLNKLRNKLVFG